MAEQPEAHADATVFEPAGPRPAVFTVAAVRGVIPAKWARIWHERHPDLPLELITTDDDQTDVLRERRAKMAFVRLPIDREGLNTIPLYSELAVVVVPKDHVIAAVDEVERADLTDESVLEVGPIDDTLALVAAGVGVVVLPQSIARLHARRDLTYRPITDAPTTEIALAWVAEDHALDDAERGALQEFIGIVRGRTARSSRGTSNSTADAKAASGAKGKSAASSKKAKKGGTGAKSGERKQSRASGPARPSKSARTHKSSAAARKRRRS